MGDKFPWEKIISEALKVKNTEEIGLKTHEVKTPFGTFCFLKEIYGSSKSR